MTTPIVIVFFNRIEPLRKLVDRLAEVTPTKVYLISDGARESRMGETEAVDACRQFMLNLSWPCEIKTNFSSQNLGCRKRVITGLDWVFEQEDRAIILEDDCIPELSFFPFMEKALAVYATNEKVISVGGTNYCESRSPQTEDVLFTKYPVSTGWGTWRRAWCLMDGELSRLQEARESGQLRKWLGCRRAERYWLYVLEKKSNSWAYRWAFTAFMNEMVCALSTGNLIANEGMEDPTATNTTAAAVMSFPAANAQWRFRGVFPKLIVPCECFDRYIEDVRYSKSFVERAKWIWRKLKKTLALRRKAS